MDSVRAAAALSIAVVHATLAANAYWTTWVGRNIVGHMAIGVPLFFAISGFLLYRPFISTREGGPQIKVSGFAWRRILRLVPAYWAALVVYQLIFNQLSADSRVLDLHLFGDHWWVFFGLLGGQDYLFDPFTTCGQAFCFFGPTWSLAVEGMLYALLPVYMIAIRRISQSRSTREWVRMEAIGLGMLALISIAAAAYYAGGHEDLTWLNYNPLTQALPFVCGMGLAVASVAVRTLGRDDLVERVGSAAMGCWTGAAILFVVIAAFVPPYSSLLTVPERMVEYVAGAVLVTLILMPVVFRPARDRLPHRLLNTKVLSWIGAISYGLFLWHWAVASYLVDAGAITWIPGSGTYVLIAGTIIGGIAAGALSYYIIERPFLRLKRLTWSPGTRVRPIAPEPQRSEANVIPGVQGPKGGAVPESSADVPDALKPPPGNPRFPALDGVRGMAALMIIAFHSALLPGSRGGFVGGELIGYLDFGVPIFLTLSAFLLYRPFIAERYGGARAPAVPVYAKRRLLRIFPGFLVAAAGYAVYPGLDGLSQNWWIYFGLLQSFTWLYDPVADCNNTYCGVLHAWTVTVELTFYALLPLYAAATGWFWRWGGARSWLRVEALVGIVAAGVGVLAYQAFLDDPLGNLWLAISLAGAAVWFVPGIVLAISSVRATGREGSSPLLRSIADHPGLGFVLAGAVYVLLAVLTPPSGTDFRLWGVLLKYFAYGAMAFFVVAPFALANHRSRDTWLYRLLSGRLMRWLGLVSYGTYLWHFGVVNYLVFETNLISVPADGWGVLLLTTCSILISVSIGALSYYVIERPFLRMKYS